ncbi:nuclear transport factor 2 family protein [Nitriliruptor alkaliphilus]|uniref:nuclear transport factor 2 family protein n=1 Tax=Nitriliruptor alkaliphilus TaxID=427918 RepID=UPI0006975C11|nr:nuclear transport factor 2 family protein [Nitriliruptor alkaliphilus]
MKVAVNQERTMNSDGTEGPPSLMSDEEVFAATRRCIDAWHTLDVATTLASYTEDVVYRDPKTRGFIVGHDQLGRYLDVFFRVWDMRFHIIDERRLAGQNGQLCMWDVEATHRRTGRSTTISGMDLCLVEDGRLSRDEAFMDTLPLETLKG